MARRLALAFAIAFHAVAGTVLPAAAQSRPAISIELPPRNSPPRGEPTFRIHNAFSDDRSRELLTSGFPARISVNLELWQSRRWFDESLDATRWELVVQHNPLTNTFRVSRVEGDTMVSVGSYQTIDALSEALAQPWNARGVAPPPGRDRLYYTANLTISLLNSDDLAELERWLRGEAEPAVRGRRSPLSALAAGLRTLASRLLGGDTKQAKATSELFSS